MGTPLMQRIDLAFEYLARNRRVRREAAVIVEVAWEIASEWHTNVTGERHDDAWEGLLEIHGTFHPCVLDEEGTWADPAKELPCPTLCAILDALVPEKV